MSSSTKRQPVNAKSGSQRSAGKTTVRTPKSTRSLSQPKNRLSRTPTSGRYPANTQVRLFGIMSLILISLAAIYYTSVEGSLSGAVGDLFSHLGIVSILILIVFVGVPVLSLFAPRLLLEYVDVKRLSAVVVLAVSGLTLLGLLHLGGMWGNSLADVLWQAMGVGAAALVLVGVLIGLLLMGVPPRNIRDGFLLCLKLAIRGSVLLARLFSKLAKLLISCFCAVLSRFARFMRSRRKPVVVVNHVKPTATKKVPRDIREIPKLVLPQKEDPVVSQSSSSGPLPPIELLEPSEQVEISEIDAMQKAKIIEDTLSTFGVEAYVREINPGPTVTQFALEPGRGTKVSKITSLQNDLALALAASSIRIEAPVPGKPRVGIEIPNNQSITVKLRDVMDTSEFQNSKAKLKLALGRGVTGRPVVGDLAKMPHLLIAGATGAGKSVCLNSIITGLLFQHTPDSLRFLMVDPKMVELKTYDGIPHLLWPVVTDTSKVVGVLKYAVAEMERRYKLLSELGIRNIDAYNKRAESDNQPKLPQIVIIIDELADLMMVAPDEVESLICRLAQMARAVGIHLVIATQRPSVDVLTGLIKANFPSRIAFAVSSQIDSRVILDMPGAERLLGRGDMLFLGPDSSKPIRVQGTHVSDVEIESVVKHWIQVQPAQYDPEVGRIIDAETQKTTDAAEDPLYQEAVEIANSTTKVSTSLLQRRLRIGYNRASRLMDALRDNGIIDATSEG